MWPWLLGPYVTACRRFHLETADLLEPIREFMATRGAGQLPEAAEAYAAGLAKAKAAGLREKLHYKLGWVRHRQGTWLRFR